jgi:Lon protease-like protein
MIVQMPGDPPRPALPDVIPIFPLPGVLLLPRGRLPLHVFEPRYRAMVEDALGGNRFVGMIQPLDPESREMQPAVYPVGCAGRITAFRELEGGRYLITLTGVSRFRAGEELLPMRGYRRVVPSWTGFAADLEEICTIGFDRSRLYGSLRGYLTTEGIAANWEAIESAPDERLVTSLAMICPFAASEKQALLEAADLAERAKLLTSLIEMAIMDRRDGESRACH